MVCLVAYATSVILDNPVNAAQKCLLFVAGILCIWRMCTVQQNKNVMLSEVTVPVDFSSLFEASCHFLFGYNAAKSKLNGLKYFDFVQNFASNTHFTYSSPIIPRPLIHMTLPGNNETSTKNRDRIKFLDPITILEAELHL